LKTDKANHFKVSNCTGKLLCINTNLELVSPLRFALKSLWSQEIRFSFMVILTLATPHTAQQQLCRFLTNSWKKFGWGALTVEMSATIRSSRNNSAPTMAKLHCASVCPFLQNKVLRLYGHGGARSVIPAGGPPRFVGTYTLGNRTIRRRWNHVKTCFWKVHQKILHKHRIFYDNRYEFSIFFTNNFWKFYFISVTYKHYALPMNIDETAPYYNSKLASAWCV
jgi:hypothetical protein